MYLSICAAARGALLAHGLLECVPVGARRMACDRAASREARKAVRELLLDRGVPISPSCPLHPDNDRLLPHESRKRMLSRAQWQCAEPRHRTAP